MKFAHAALFSFSRQEGWGMTPLDNGLGERYTWCVPVLDNRNQELIDTASSRIVKKKTHGLVTSRVAGSCMHLLSQARKQVSLQSGRVVSMR